MTDEIKARIAKIYELVKRGASDGEKAAAGAALDRLMTKYNLSAADLESIDKKWYSFTYATDLEHHLLCRIITFFLEDSEAVFNEAYRTTFDEKTLTRCKQIRLNLTYLDYVTVESAYEYFRRHMKAQWDATCAPVVKRCRKTKTRNKKRKELQQAFLTRYIIASKLIDPKYVTRIDPSELSMKELERLRALQGVQGGSYSTQVQSAHMLEAPKEPLPTQNKQLTIF